MAATITIDQLQKDTRKHVARAHAQPVEVTDGNGTVAVILSIEDYNALYAASMRRLLAKRMKEPTVPHEEVFARFQTRIRRHRRKA